MHMLGDLRREWDGMKPAQYDAATCADKRFCDWRWLKFGWTLLCRNVAMIQLFTVDDSNSWYLLRIQVADPTLSTMCKLYIKDFLCTAKYVHGQAFRRLGVAQASRNRFLQ